MTKLLSWKCKDIIKATGGSLLTGEKGDLFENISINSREICPNTLFVAIKGNNHDGHDFMAHALKNGTSGFLINREKLPVLHNLETGKEKITCLAVEDTIIALGDLASFNIKRSGVSVVAITGSSGKTTTKEMTAAVLGKGFNTLSTPGNYNNNIGLPLTAFKLGPFHQWAVLELGMNRPEEIKNLAGICNPDIGVITNIGHAHIGAFDSIEGIVAAKAELAEKIKNNGVLVLNGDDPRVLQIGKRTSKRLLVYGTGSNAEIKGEKIKKIPEGISFTLNLPGEKINIEIKAHGEFMVLNGLAAAAAGFLAGLDGTKIKAGLEEFLPEGGRFNLLETKNGIHIINDTYNANPDSMKAAMGTLNSLRGNKRGLLVLGDMLELGKHGDSMHMAIGAFAADSGAEKLYLTGAFADQIARGALNRGMTHQNIFVGTKKEAVEALSRETTPGDWVLVKGSRGSSMEDVVTGLTALRNGGEI
ncbi:MAG TPA: UDP-N-acetylmuramoyl-tripeptide--D-alanyl-D-alanine ligase, partial [Desulfobacteraceae bacterium]|nr:UDP-N-acetylmuramoyl-tripeptide--D-alanyl-D-alanine ligase [Desulfobacteraceae bacterium]